LGDWQKERLDLVNAFLAEPPVGNLVSVDDPRTFIQLDAGKLIHPWYGGFKHLECEMAIGTANHLDLEKFVAFLKSDIPWNDSYDGTCQLLAKEQETYRFKLIDIYDPYS
jgi:hypothetical protein